MKKIDGLALFQERFMATYAPFGNIIVRGEGSYLYDAEGRRYLDFCSGIAVSSLGHCHPAVVQAVREQAGKLMHVSNLYIHETELRLAERLIRLAFPGRLFLCQSGAEANDTAVKLARKYARTVLKQDRWKVITAVNSFHGRTLGMVAATGQAKYQAGYEPLLEGFVHVPYNDLDAVAEALDGQTCAVMMEPIQGEGGVIVPDEGYLRLLQRLCADRGALLILDEVQTGFGRTGEMFAYQREEMTPDIMTMAKALGGGLPLGGVLAKPAVAAAFSPGNHATTFGGNPVTCAAALAVLRVMEEESLPFRARELGALLLEGLGRLGEEFPGLVAGRRGVGLLLGLEMTVPAKELMENCRREGLLLSVVQDRILRFTPPLTVSTGEIGEGLAARKER